MAIPRPVLLMLTPLSHTDIRMLMADYKAFALSFYVFFGTVTLQFICFMFMQTKVSWKKL
jgi:hypothetical protein